MLGAEVRGPCREGRVSSCPGPSWVGRLPYFSHTPSPTSHLEDFCPLLNGGKWVPLPWALTSSLKNMVGKLFNYCFRIDVLVRLLIYNLIVLLEAASSSSLDPFE